MRRKLSEETRSGDSIVKAFALLASGTTALVFAGTLNAQASPTIVKNASDLRNIDNNLSGDYILGANIDLSTFPNWTPIGDGSNPFTGSLDGTFCTSPNDPLSCKTYKISNLRITSSSSAVGLFGVVKGAIRNVGLENVSIQLTVNDGIYATVGALAGNIGPGSVDNAYTTGKLDVSLSNSAAATNTGGLVGYLSGTVKRSFSTVDVHVSGAMDRTA